MEQIGFTIYTPNKDPQNRSGLECRILENGVVRKQFVVKQSRVLELSDNQELVIRAVNDINLVQVID